MMTASKENAASVENLLYFNAAAEEDDIYQDIGEAEDDTAAINTTKYMSENENETELFSTAESSQVDAAVEENDEMVENASEVVDEQMKEVIEKLDRDLNTIVQISDEFGKSMDNEPSPNVTQQEDNQQDNQGDQHIPAEEIAEEQDVEDINQPEAANQMIELEEEKEENVLEVLEEEEEAPYVGTEETENDDNLNHDEQSSQLDVSISEHSSDDAGAEDFDLTDSHIDDTAIPMAVEEDDDDFNDIDYIDEEEDLEDVAGAMSDGQESVEDIERPFSADVFERHVQQVIEEDFPDNKDAIAPAVQIISSKLNQMMSREAMATKTPPADVVTPYEVSIIYR